MFNYIIYRFGQFLSLSLPLKLAYKVAVFVSDLHYLFAFKDKKIVRENLEAIFPDKSKKEICRIRKAMFRNFAKYLADFFRFAKIDKDYIKDKIKIVNKHYLDEAITKKKGTIVLTAHIGNWELGGVVVALLGYRFSAVALPHKDKKVNDFFNYQRESKGLKVIPLGKAVKACINVLKENGVLALVGDRDFTNKGMVIDFFGKPTFFPEGPAAFALKTGGQIVPGFMLRNQDDSFTLNFHKPINAVSSSDRKKDVLELIEKYKTVIESYIRDHPDQWYMFRKFWINEKI